MGTQALGLPESAVRSFVLDNDPVPRAMLSADPTFALLKQSAPVSWLLQVRGNPALPHTSAALPAEERI